MNYPIKGGVCIRHGAMVKRCSVDGCMNGVIKGGVCRRHGAKVKVKQCSSDGCTNNVQRRGVCRRHGAYRNDESTAFDLSCRSVFDETTATLPNHYATTAPGVQDASSIPPSEILCQVIDHFEV